MPRGRRPASASRGPDQGRVSIMKIDGGCHCGYITYEAEADPEKTTICHCTDCQHLSGSAFRTVVRVAGDTFKIIAGEPTIYVKTPKAAQDGCKDSAPDVERQSTRLPKETSRNCTPSVWGLYANVLRSSRRCRFGLVRNCTGSPTWPPFVGWTGSELRRLITMHGISSAACRFLRSRIPNALPLGNRA
jgi:hypothetical protein